MLVVISPANRLDWAERDVETTAPDFQDDAARLVKTARNLTLGDLKSLMSLSQMVAVIRLDFPVPASDSKASIRSRMFFV